MKILERILIGVFFGCTIARDAIPLLEFEKGIVISGTALGLLYLIGFYWLQKPVMKNFRTVSLTLLYGIVCFQWSFSFLFIAMYLTGDQEMLITAAIATTIVVGIDLLSSIGKKRVIDAPLFTRMASYFFLCTLLVSVPQRVRIDITYRKDPAFLKFYHEKNQHGKWNFDEIKHGYYDGWILMDSTINAK